MANSNRRGGTVQLQLDGVVHDIEGEFTIGYGTPKREPIIGSNRVIGYKEVPQVAFIQGKVIDSAGLDVKALCNATDVTANMKLATGKTAVLRDAWYAGSAELNTGDGGIDFRIESASEAEEV